MRPAIWPATPQGIESRGRWRDNYKFSAEARDAFIRYIALRKAQPLFSNARSIRNALDRMRLRQANRLVADLDCVLTAHDIMSIEAADVLASRVFLAPRETGV